MASGDAAPRSACPCRRTGPTTENREIVRFDPGRLRSPGERRTVSYPAHAGGDRILRVVAPPATRRTADEVDETRSRSHRARHGNRGIRRFGLTKGTQSETLGAGSENPTPPFLPQPIVHIILLVTGAVPGLLQ